MKILINSNIIIIVINIYTLLHKLLFHIPIMIGSHYVFTRAWLISVLDYNFLTLKSVIFISNGAMHRLRRSKHFRSSQFTLGAYKYSEYQSYFSNQNLFKFTQIYWSPSPCPVSTWIQNGPSRLLIVWCAKVYQHRLAIIFTSLLFVNWLQESIDITIYRYLIWDMKLGF